CRRGLQDLVGIFRGISRAKIGVAHLFFHRSFTRDADVGNSSRSQRGARISGGALYKEPLEWTFTLTAPVRNNVEGHASSHAEILARHLAVQVADLLQHDLFEDHLDAL